MTKSEIPTNCGLKSAVRGQLLITGLKSFLKATPSLYVIVLLQKQNHIWQTLKLPYSNSE